MKKEYIIYVIIVVGAVMFADKIRQTPVVGKLIPTV